MVVSSFVLTGRLIFGSRHLGHGGGSEQALDLIAQCIILGPDTFRIGDLVFALFALSACDAFLLVASALPAVPAARRVFGAAFRPPLPRRFLARHGGAPNSLPLAWLHADGEDQRVVLLRLVRRHDRQEFAA